MVKTGLTAAGGLLTAAGAGLMVGVALMETFVVVHVPFTGKCGLDDDTIAQIGVYTSSYDPKCAFGTPEFATFGRIATIESVPTLEFPLLFPTQTGYGGALGTVEKFESCEKAWAANGTLDSAALSAGALGFFPNVDAGFQANAEVRENKLLLKTFLNGVGGAPSLTATFDGVVNGLWKAQVEDSVIEKFVDASNTVLGFANGTIQNVTDDCVADTEQVLAGNFTTTCTMAPFSSVHTFLLTKMDALVPAGDSPLLEALILYNSTYAPAAPTAFKGVVGIDVTKELEDQMFLGAKSVLQVKAAGGDQKSGAGLALLDMCVGESTTKQCNEKKIYEISNAEISASSTKEDNLCRLMYLDAAAAAAAEQKGEDYNKTFAGSDSLLAIQQTCIYNDAANVLLGNGNIATLVAQAGIPAPPGMSQEQLVQIATYIVAKLSSNQCSSTTVGECVKDLDTQIEADFSGVPENLESADWIPAVLGGFAGPSALFNETLNKAQTALVNATVSGASAEEISKLTAAVIQAGVPVFVLGACTKNGAAVTRSTCSVALPQVLKNAMLSPDPKTAGTATLIKGALVAGASTSLLEGETEADRIKACNDDEQDIAVFETAQMMVPAAIGCASVGMLLSFAAVATQKMPVALVGGLLSVAGGGILMGALLYIQSEAPVYKKLQESADAGPKAGKLYYKGGQAQLLALAAVGSSVVGGLVTIGSAFCGNGDEESSALTPKVDNTY